MKPAYLSVLASGSSGNAALVAAGGRGVLIDCGLGPRELGFRLASSGASWNEVAAVVVTHTHGDHWNRTTLIHLARLRIPLFAHPRHMDHFAETSEEFAFLMKQRLVRPFDAAAAFEPVPGFRVTPVRVPHDSDPTFAFRIDTADGAVGYASDAGHAPPELVPAFAGVNVLAVEFNHDEALQRASGRPQNLIERVLGRNGHLSNRQAAEVCRAVAEASAGTLGHVVQLHLSRQCNRPALAVAAGAAAVPGVKLWTASQGMACGPVPLAGPKPATSSVAGGAKYAYQPRLPGLE